MFFIRTALISLTASFILPRPDKERALKALVSIPNRVLLSYLLYVNSFQTLHFMMEKLQGLCYCGCLCTYQHGSGCSQAANRLSWYSLRILSHHTVPKTHRRIDVRKVLSNKQRRIMFDLSVDYLTSISWNCRFSRLVKTSVAFLLNIAFIGYYFLLQENQN